MSSIQHTLLPLGLVFLLSCEKQACQNPPPGYNIAFTNAQGQAFINDSLQATTLRLSNVSATGVRTLISSAKFRPIASNDRYKFIYNVGYDLFGQNEQNQYSIEFNNTVIGDLILKSRRDNSKCDGWMHLTEVRFNNQPINQNADNVTYAIKLNL